MEKLGKRKATKAAEEEPLAKRAKTE